MGVYQLTASDSRALTIAAAEVLTEAEKLDPLAPLAGPGHRNVIWQKFSKSPASNAIQFTYNKRLTGRVKRKDDRLTGQEEKQVFYSQNVERDLIKDSVAWEAEMTPAVESKIVIGDEAKDQILEKYLEDLATIRQEALDTSYERIVYSDAGTIKNQTAIATATAALTAVDKLTPDVVAYAAKYAQSGGRTNAGARAFTPIRPAMIGRERLFVMLISSQVAYDYITNPTYEQYVLAAANRGKDHPIFQLAIAKVHNVLLVESEYIKQTANASSIPYSICHLLGRTALLEAWHDFKIPGLPKGRFIVFPTLDQHGEVATIDYKAGVNVEKSVRNSDAYGSIAVAVANTSFE